MTFSLAAMVLVSAGCDDFATPAELSRAQILGIASDPASIEPGESATLDILVAGPDGEIVAPEVRWSVVEPAPMIPPVGSVEVDSGGAVTYTAPTAVPDNPTIAAVQAIVQVGDEPLVGLKGMIISTVAIGNPTLRTFTATGAATTDLITDDLIMSANVPVSLGVSTLPSLGDDAQVSWYSTIGTIERYRSNPTEIVAEESGDGWLFVVIRNGVGGITWSKTRIRVE